MAKKMFSEDEIRDLLGKDLLTQEKVMQKDIQRTTGRSYVQRGLTTICKDQS